MSDIDIVEEKSEKSGPFKEGQLNAREHMDPDKHWIGETLPAPSVGEVQYSGDETSVGESPFPARADHKHDIRVRFGGYATTGAGQNIAAGATEYLNSLHHYWGEDFRHSGSQQLFDFPVEGVWQVTYGWYCTRTSGSFAAGTAAQIMFGYNNAATFRYLMRQDMPVAGTISFGHCSTLWYLPTIIFSSNFQIRVANEDAVSWNWRSLFLDIRRLASYTGAEST